MLYLGMNGRPQASTETLADILAATKSEDAKVKAEASAKLESMGVTVTDTGDTCSGSTPLQKGMYVRLAAPAKEWQKCFAPYSFKVTDNVTKQKVDRSAIGLLLEFSWSERFERSSYICFPTGMLMWDESRLQSETGRCLDGSPIAYEPGNVGERLHLGMTHREVAEAFGDKTYKVYVKLFVRKRLDGVASNGATRLYSLVAV